MTYNAKPLTQAETKWIKRLEKVLNSCPSERLELVTIGDSSFTVIDGLIVKEHDVEIHDGLAERNGVAIGYVYGDIKIHGVSG